MIFFIFIFGGIFGSFSYLLIDRSLRDKSIIYPPSHCPNCKKKIFYRDLIPVISYIFLRGRCRFCKAKIPISYFLYEILFGILAIFILNLDFKLKEILIFLSLSIGFAIGIIDFKKLYIDMAYIYLLIFLGLIYRFLYIAFSLEFFKILLVFSLIFILIYYISRKNIGDGDYFFYIALFLFLENKLILPFILISIWSAAIFSLILAIKYRSLKIKIGLCPYIFMSYFLLILGVIV